MFLALPKTGRCVTGQLIVTLGVANDEQFTPIDNEIFISKRKEQALDYQFKDGRSIAAKRYQQSKLLFAKQEEGLSKLSDARNEFEESLTTLNFACKLWGLFKALIAGALREMSKLTTTEKSDVLEKIDQTVINFFMQVMQMDNFTLR